MTLSPEANEFNLRGNALLADNDPAGAVVEFDRAIRLTPRSEAALLYYNRGTARHLHGDLDGALADFNEAIAIDGNYAEAFNNRGMNRQARGELEAALADFDRAITIVPGYPQAHNNRGIIFRALGNSADALMEFNRAITCNPNYAEAFNNRGVVRQAGGDLLGALADFDRAIAIAPAYAEAYSNRGIARQNLAEERNPCRSRMFIDRGTLVATRADLADAIADFDRALALLPRHAAASVYHNRGAARQAQGDLTGALADFDQALEIHPGHAPTFANRGTACKALGNLTGALDDLDRAIALTPRCAAAPVYHNRGGVRVLLGDLAGAVADYDQALEINPDLQVAYLSRGNARYHQRDLAAFTDHWHVLKQNSELAVGEIIQMIVDDVQQNAAAVLANCDKHLRSNPLDVTAYCRRGLTRVVLGQLDAEAEHDFSQVQRLQPDFYISFALLIEEAKRLSAATEL